MVNNKYVQIEPSNYKNFNIVLFLDIGAVLKLPVKYIRQEKGNVSYRYAFEFKNISRDDSEIISKYIMKEQIKQRQREKELTM